VAREIGSGKQKDNWRVSGTWSCKFYNPNDLENKRTTIIGAFEWTGSRI